MHLPPLDDDAFTRHVLYTATDGSDLRTALRVVEIERARARADAGFGMTRLVAGEAAAGYEWVATAGAGATVVEFDEAGEPTARRDWA